MWEWNARIHFKKYELGTSFSVLIFLGTVPEDPEDWRTTGTFVGAHHAFVSKTGGKRTNHGDVVDEGFVQLNQAIAQHSGLNSFEPEVIKPFLTKELHWRVQRVCQMIFCLSTRFKLMPRFS
jgi:tyrosinase